MASTVVDILVNVRRVTKEVSISNEAFAIAPGVYGVFKKGTNVLESNSPSLETSETVELLKEILEGVDTLTAKTSERSKEILKQQNHAGEAYHTLLQYVQSYSQDQEDEESISAITDHITGLHCQLTILHNAMVNPTPSNLDQMSLIDYISTRCQDRAAKDDFTWGFTMACEILSFLLALQRSAIQVLRGVMETLGDPVERVDLVEKDHHTNIDEQVEKFLTVFGKHWNQKAGEMKKSNISLHECLPSFVSHNGELYWVSWFGFEGVFKQFMSGIYPEANHNVALRGMSPLASHQGKLFCVTKAGKLSEIDPESGETRELFPDVSFKQCVSMISHEGFLYLTLNSRSENIFKVDTREMKVECIGSQWQAAMLATLEGESSIFVRYKHFLWDSIYRIDSSSNGTTSFEAVSKYWDMTMSALIVGHGEHLYTQGYAGDLLALNPVSGKSLTFTPKPCFTPDSHVLPLVSHKLTLICRHFIKWYSPVERYHMALVRPYWVEPPKDWYKKLQFGLQ